jgi:hypothetical protein
MKKILLGFLGVMAFSQAAIANGFVTSSTGRQTFVFTGLSPNQTHSVKIVGWPRDRSVTPNACGLTVVKPSSGGVILQLAFPSSSPIRVSDLPLQTLPVCSGGQLAEPRTANFRTSEGSVVLVGQSGSIRLIEDITKSIKSNECGNARLGQPKSTFNGWWFDGTTFQIAGQELQAEDLLAIVEMSICKKVGGQFIKYVPL